MRSAPAASLAVVLAACGFAPLDVTGLRCDERRACGPGFECVSGRCVVEGTEPPDGGDGGLDAGRADDAGADGGLDAGTPDAGTPLNVNLLANPGFEVASADGGVDAWRLTTGALVASVPGRDGGRAALATAVTESSPVLVPIAPGPRIANGEVYCGSVWVRGAADAGLVAQLTFRQQLDDGGVESRSATVTVLPTFRRLDLDDTMRGAGRVEWRLGFNTSRVDAGSFFLADDASLVRTTANCP